ncbi:MAG: hypothetical protein HY537_11510 [Deltaproteobacteria bacterium]|nr:hypothetical protein [Deltaproteobacteria bacterium]
MVNDFRLISDLVKPSHQQVAVEFLRTFLIFEALANCDEGPFSADNRGKRNRSRRKYEESGRVATRMTWQKYAMFLSFSEILCNGYTTTKSRDAIINEFFEVLMKSLGNRQHLLGPLLECYFSSDESDEWGKGPERVRNKIEQARERLRGLGIAQIALYFESNNGPQAHVMNKDFAMFFNEVRKAYNSGTVIKITSDFLPSLVVHMDATVSAVQRKRGCHRSAVAKDGGPFSQGPVIVLQNSKALYDLVNSIDWSK